MMARTARQSEMAERLVDLSQFSFLLPTKFKKFSVRNYRQLSLGHLGESKYRTVRTRCADPWGPGGRVDGGGRRGRRCFTLVGCELQRRRFLWFLEGSRQMRGPLLSLRCDETQLDRQAEQQPRARQLQADTLTLDLIAPRQDSVQRVGLLPDRRRWLGADARRRGQRYQDDLR